MQDEFFSASRLISNRSWALRMTKTINYSTSRLLRVPSMDDFRSIFTLKNRTSVSKGLLFIALLAGCTYSKQPAILYGEDSINSGTAKCLNSKEDNITIKIEEKYNSFKEGMIYSFERATPNEKLLSELKFVMINSRLYLAQHSPINQDSKNPIYFYQYFELDQNEERFRTLDLRVTPEEAKKYNVIASSGKDQEVELEGKQSDIFTFLSDYRSRTFVRNGDRCVHDKSFVRRLQLSDVSNNKASANINRFQKNLPVTSTFMGALGACATSNNIKLNGSVSGSIQQIYEGARTEGNLTLEQGSSFLSVFPEQDRIVAYRIYAECITRIISP